MCSVNGGGVVDIAVATRTVEMSHLFQVIILNLESFRGFILLFSCKWFFIILRKIRILDFV